MRKNQFQEGYGFLSSLQERFQSDERVKSAVHQYLSNEIPAMGSLDRFLDEYSFRKGLYSAFAEAYPEEQLDFSWISQHLVLFKHLQAVAYALLEDAPEEEFCSKREDELIAELVNLVDLVNELV